MNEQDLAKRVVSQLDDGLNDLPAGTLYRLRLAREAALSHAEIEQPASRLADGMLSGGGGSARLLNRRILVPLFGIIVGLSILLFWQQQTSRQPDFAELDAQVLTDELPVTAYLDTGFEVWLYHHTAD